MEGLPSAIPKIIWSYWHAHQVPSFVSEAHSTWKKLDTEWTIHALHAESPLVLQLQEVDEISAKTLEKAFFADWLRLALLEKYGGVWMDASIFLNDPSYLDQFHAEACTKQVEVAGFHIPPFQTLPTFPVMENWMIMAPPQSPFIRAWRQEHLRALRSGFPAYRAKIESEQKVNPQKIFKNFGTYLTQHVCAQAVMQLRNNLPSSYALLRNALEGPFLLQQDCKWSPACIGAQIHRNVYTQLPIVKLRRCDRKFGTRAQHSLPIALVFLVIGFLALALWKYRRALLRGSPSKAN
jgi:hypothetical protein